MYNHLKLRILRFHYIRRNLLYLQRQKVLFYLVCHVALPDRLSRTWTCSRVPMTLCSGSDLVLSVEKRSGEVSKSWIILREPWIFTPDFITMSELLIRLLTSVKQPLTLWRSSVLDSDHSFSSEIADYNQLNHYSLLCLIKMQKKGERSSQESVFGLSFLDYCSNMAVQHDPEDEDSVPLQI